MRLKALLSHAQLPAQARVSHLRVEEGLSRLFEITVEFVYADPGLELAKMLGTDGAVLVAADDGSSRAFHGFVEEAEYVGRRGDLFAYRLKLMPRIQGLAHRVRSRIFQEKSVVKIIQDVFSGAGIPEEECVWSATEGPEREYCTQWKESELAFVLRLLEEEGIFFWFEHSEAGHVLHLADSAAAHQPIEGLTGLFFTPWDDQEGRRDLITQVTYTSRLVPDAVMLRDWNWRTPQQPQEAKLAAQGQGGLELYEYPSGFSSAAAGKRRAEDRLASARVRQRVLRGVTPCLLMSPGRSFLLFDAEPAPINREYLLLEVLHVFEDPTAATLGGEAGRYRAELLAVPSEVEFRPPRVTPRPRVVGKESGVITGPPGEEIHVDEFGRVKVKFYWDREGKMDDTASCWMRVQQQNTASSQVLPRVGWEVEVGFHDGDPDRPVVLQKLYNQETMPPYALPDNLMQSSLQSSSTPGGGGTNELRMNDGNGGMEFFLHAQKDLSVTVGNNLTEQIAVDEAVQVKADCTVSIGATEAISVGANQSASITGERVEDVAGALKVSVGAVDQWGVGAMHNIAVKGARSEDIGGLKNVLAEKVSETFNADLTTQVGGALSISSVGPIVEAVAGNKTETIGGAKLEIIAKAKAENVGVGKLLTAGAVKIKTGQDVTFAAEAAMAITTGGPMVIQCGGDFNISGSSVTINVGKASLDAGAKIDATPASMKLKGGKVGGDGAQLKIKGTIKYK